MGAPAHLPALFGLAHMPRPPPPPRWPLPRGPPRSSTADSAATAVAYACAHSAAGEGACFACLAEQAAQGEGARDAPPAKGGPAPTDAPHYADLIPVIPVSLAAQASASNSSFGSASTSKTVRFVEEVTVCWTWSKDEYRARSSSAPDVEGEDWSDDETDLGVPHPPTSPLVGAAPAPGAQAKPQADPWAPPPTALHDPPPSPEPPDPLQTHERVLSWGSEQYSDAGAPPSPLRSPSAEAMVARLSRLMNAADEALAKIGAD